MATTTYDKTQLYGLMILNIYFWISILSGLLSGQFTPLALPIYPIYSNIIGIQSAASENKYWPDLIL